jgi:hypothetical protein
VTGATDAAWPGAKAVMLIDVIAATIHRTPVLGFCMGAPRKRRPSQLRLLLKTYVYQGARLRTMGSSPFGEQHEWAMRELCEMTTKKGGSDRISGNQIDHAARC